MVGYIVPWLTTAMDMAIHRHCYSTDVCAPASSRDVTVSSLKCRLINDSQLPQKLLSISIIKHGSFNPVLSRWTLLFLCLGLHKWCLCKNNYRHFEIILFFSLLADNPNNNTVLYTKMKIHAFFFLEMAMLSLLVTLFLFGCNLTPANNTLQKNTLKQNKIDNQGNLYNMYRPTSQNI